MRKMRLAVLIVWMLSLGMSGYSLQEANILPTPLKPWEYLVISFGKTEFADPVLIPEYKQSGLSKIILFSAAGIVKANEAIDIQKQMDRLGRFGWELVGVVGTIGGDQQMLFKRPFDPNQSIKEAALIKAEGELIAEEQKKEKERIAKQAATDELVDLDAVERQASIDVEAKSLSADMMNYKDNPIKIISLDPTQDFQGHFKAVVHIQVDGTAKLVQANKYRSSDAQALAKLVSDDIYTKSKLKDRTSLGKVQINIVVVIRHGNVETPVAYEFTGGDRLWSDGKDVHP